MELERDSRLSGLLDAALRKDLEGLKTHLDSSMEVPDEVVVCAARGGWSDCVKLLLQHGMDIDATVSGDTALTLAARGGHLDTVRVLLDAGCDIDKPSKNMQTALAWATFYGNTEMVRELLARKACPDTMDTTLNKAPIVIAATYGYTEIASLLLNANCEVNGYEFPPLHEAVRNNYLSIVKLLIERGADVNAIDHGGYTPLHHAACNKNRSEVIKMLKDSGANINAYDGQLRSTPLALAIRCGRHDNIKALIEAGCNVNDGIEGFYSVTPLLLAINHNDAESVRLLLEAGADPDLQNHNTGKTPLLLATEENHKEITRLLIENNCDLDKFTPVAVALETGHFEIAKLLVAAGCDLFPAREWLRQQPISTEDESEDSVMEDMAWLIDACNKPPSLLELSRRIILKNLRSHDTGDLMNLPLPHLLKTYINLQ
ncbi:ankyrin repeat domain-containing protein 17 [Lingula anatina]|uniref:Ankyrin repeat domain-containing protein 17 n=1 Tax=Lingula anatina TaxID=7574 RepID=A0A1S3JKZ5_LINAN|nr:ankyrin repeat domain-containing protein 17 [Lingula anatina]|eukprot:XP_013411085.1 ankyrin repeat domain-containing protein 17 [Lingula anatina]